MQLMSRRSPRSLSRCLYQPRHRESADGVTYRYEHTPSAHVPDRSCRLFQRRSNPNRVGTSEINCPWKAWPKLSNLWPNITSHRRRHRLMSTTSMPRGPDFQRWGGGKLWVEQQRQETQTNCSARSSPTTGCVRGEAKPVTQIDDARSKAPGPTGFCPRHRSVETVHPGFRRRSNVLTLSSRL